MEKLTPAKRLKQLKANGWLEFVEFAESKGLKPRDICKNYVGIALDEFKSNKISLWIGEDIEYDLYRPSGPDEFVHLGKVKMMGLSEQICNPRTSSYPKSKKSNKMIQRFKKTGEPI